MSPVLLIALLLGVAGLASLFVFPWVGAPLLLIAIVVFVVGLVAAGGAVASGESLDPDERDVESPHLPGPD